MQTLLDVLAPMSAVSSVVASLSPGERTASQPLVSTDLSEHWVPEPPLPPLPPPPSSLELPQAAAPSARAMLAASRARRLAMTFVGCAWETRLCMSALSITALAGQTGGFRGGARRRPTR